MNKIKKTTCLTTKKREIKMATKQRHSFLDGRPLRIALTLSSTIITTAILSLAGISIGQVYYNTYEEASKYMIWIFFLIGMMDIVLFLKKRTKLNFVRAFVVLALDVGIGVVSFFAGDIPFLFSITTGLFCLTIIVSRIFNIVQNKTKRNAVFNGLIIISALVLAVGVLVTPTDAVAEIQNIILIECLFVAGVAIVEAASVIFSQMKLTVLFRIIVNTFSLEILFGLLTMVVCFAFILSAIEPKAGEGAYNIATFPDALWYCFAVVTTIGFGDFYAVTPIGRVLTVFLGIYGIICVAVITSIIVNYYNETAGKKDIKELKEISKDEQKKE